MIDLATRHFPTNIIKIDIDYKVKKGQRLWINKRVSELGGIFILDTRTKRGVHYKIKLKRKVPFWRTIEIRSLLHDDPQRIVYDILRYRAGAQMVDVLFDKKTHIKEIIRIPI